MLHKGVQGLPPERFGQLPGSHWFITELQLIEHSLQGQRNALRGVVALCRHKVHSLEWWKQGTEKLLTMPRIGSAPHTRPQSQSIQLANLSGIMIIKCCLLGFTQLRYRTQCIYIYKSYCKKKHQRTIICSSDNFYGRVIIHIHLDKTLYIISMS